jgi:hypothetical protein
MIPPPVDSFDLNYAEALATGVPKIKIFSPHLLFKLVEFATG